MSDSSIRAGAQIPTNQIAANTYNPLVEATVDFPTSFPIGTPVCQSSSTDRTVIPAQADSSTTAFITGLAVTPGVVGDHCKVQTTGVLTLTEAQWRAITVGGSGIVRNTRYFLDAVDPGLISSSQPAGGNWLVPIGVALSATDLLVQPCMAELLPD